MKGIRAGVMWGVLICAGGSASAHELTCDSVIDGQRFKVVDHYPAKLTYQTHVYNAHPQQASDALSVVDPLLFNEGFTFTCAPFTLPVGGFATRYFTVTVRSEEDCRALAASDGVPDAYIDNTLVATWDLGSAHCSGRVACRPECSSPPCDTAAAVTRNEGFYKVHLEPLTDCLATPVDVGAWTVGSTASALGLLWANPVVFPGGVPRQDLDRARLMLARQILVATCNARLFGRSPTLDTLLQEATAAARGESCSPMFLKESSLSEFNESGMTAPLPAPYAATPAAPVTARSHAVDNTQPAGSGCADRGGIP